jgi:hypothetical protein
MNSRRLVIDILAILGALAALAFTVFLLPDFWPIWVRALIGVLIACLLFAIYLVARPSDEVLGLQRQLETIAQEARGIQQAAGKLSPAARDLKPRLLEISTGIAQTEVRIMKRELLPSATEIRRLESLAKNFLAMTSVLTGEVYLRPSELQAKLLEIRDEHIPETLQTLQELNAVLDESRARQLASAEEELEILSALYTRNSAAYNAAEILRQVLAEPEQPSQGVQDVP